MRWPSQNAKLVKILIFGDEQCGKSSLLVRIDEGEFSTDAPRLVNAYFTQLTLDERPVPVTLWDAIGYESWDHLRPLWYPNTDVILLAYALDVPGSLASVESKWANEVRAFVPDVPVVLVCLKTDLRSDQIFLERWAEKEGIAPLPTFADGLALAHRINAARFVECSSKTGQGVYEVTQYALQLAFSEKLLRRRRRWTGHPAGGGNARASGPGCVVC